jgi:hypothetical protein
MKEMKLVKSGKRGTESYSYQGDTSASLFKYRRTLGSSTAKYRGASKQVFDGTIRQGTIMQAISKNYPYKMRFLKVREIKNQTYTLDLLYTVDSKQEQLVHGYGTRTFTTLVPGTLQKPGAVTATLGKLRYKKETLKLTNGLLGDKEFSVAIIHDPVKHPVLKQTHEGSKLVKNANNVDTLR